MECSDRKSSKNRTACVFFTKIHVPQERERASFLYDCVAKFLDPRLNVSVHRSTPMKFLSLDLEHIFVRNVEISGDKEAFLRGDGIEQVTSISRDDLVAKAASELVSVGDMDRLKPCLSLLVNRAPKGVFCRRMGLMAAEA